MNSIKKIANEIMKSAVSYKERPYIVDDNLTHSLYNLVKYNNGLFKSDKQMYFFKGNLTRSQRKKNDDFEDSDFGIIASSFKELSNGGVQYEYIIDNLGVRLERMLKAKLVRGISRAEAERQFENMTEKQQEQVGMELLHEDTKDRYEWSGERIMWERKKEQPSSLGGQS